MKSILTAIFATWMFVNSVFALGIMDYTEVTAPVGTEWIYMVNNPGGAGTDRRVQVSNLVDVTVLGVDYGDVHMGTFTGDLLTDSQTIKALFQIIETELEDTVSVSSNGLIARTGDGTAEARTITAGNGMAVSNGDGVSGNPTISLPTTGISAGAYTNVNITVDAYGRITVIGNGSTGGVSAYESGTEVDFYGTILNPEGVYDNDATNHAVTIAVNIPAAFTITSIYISCDADPTTEPTLTFRHKAAGVGYGTPTTIEAVTTTAGVASVTTGFDDATIPANTKLFITLSDPDTTLTEIAWQIKGDWD